MQKGRQVKWVAVLLFLVMMLSGCRGGGGDTAWKYKSMITSPIQSTSGDQAVTMGDLDQHQVQVVIPGNTFEQSRAVTMVNPKEVPKVVGKQFTPMGAPIQLSAGNNETRLNEPVQVTLKMDPQAYGSSAKQPGDFWATYYDGKRWEYIQPDKVDLEAGTITFTTYHFSVFGYGKVSVEEQISQYAHDKAVGEWAQENVDKRLDDAAGKIIDHILVDKLNINDESTKKKVLANLLNNDEWADMVKRAKAGDVTGFNESLQLLAGKTIVDFVPKSTLSNALGGLSSNLGVETVKKASEAAGYLAEGQYEQAARILGEHIADQFVFTIAGRVAVAAVQGQIDTWRDKEIEAAYTAWKNGAESKVPFWGYQVKENDFDAVWEQMKGARRQIEIDAIKAQEQMRKEAGMPPLTDQEKDQIRAMAKENMKELFDERARNEKAVAEREAEIKALAALYQDKKLLTPGEWGYPDSYFSVAQRMEELIHFKDKVLRDTQRKGLSSGAFSTNEVISHGDLVALTYAWYTKPDGPQKYAQMLKDKFGIDLFPKPEDMNGTWRGNLTITGLKFPEVTPAQQSEEGCDLSAILQQLEAMKGKPMASTVTMQVTADGAGSMTVLVRNGGDDSSEPTVLPLTYQNGKITATQSKDNEVMTFTGYVSQGGDALTVNGDWKVNGRDPKTGQEASIWGVWDASKPKPAPPAAPQPAANNP